MTRRKSSSKRPVFPFLGVALILFFQLHCRVRFALYHTYHKADDIDSTNNIARTTVTPPRADSSSRTQRTIKHPTFSLPRNLWCPWPPQRSNFSVFTTIRRSVRARHDVITRVHHRMVRGMGGGIYRYADICTDSPRSKLQGLTA